MWGGRNPYLRRCFGMKLMLDLFSGLGGASQAFMDSHEWAVLRYDNNPKLANVAATTICDLKEYQIICRHDIELIWASPPCIEFSTAYNAPKSKAQRTGENYTPDLSLVRRAMEIIEELKPKYFVIENGAGASKDLEPLLGKPRQIIGPFLLWGVFPYIDEPRFWEHQKKDHDKRHDELRSNLRAKVPIEISQALMNCIESQRTIVDY